jgi:hypothetical protein
MESAEVWSMDPLSNWIDIAVTVGLGLVGLYFAHGYRHQRKLRLAEARRSAYAQLWELMGVAAPTRLDTTGPQGGLSADERGTLFEAMTAWYYRNGNGMLLEPTSRAIFFGAKHNLTCPDDQLKPPEVLSSFPSGVGVDQKRGCLSIRQLSLLRTQLMSDLAIYGTPTVRQLREHERDFLEKECHVKLDRKPWKRAARSVPSAETCGDS